MPGRRGVIRRSSGGWRGNGRAEQSRALGVRKVEGAGARMDVWLHEIFVVIADKGGRRTGNGTDILRQTAYGVGGKLGRPSGFILWLLDT